jgi:hypothetical protein
MLEAADVVEVAASARRHEVLRYVVVPASVNVISVELVSRQRRSGPANDMAAPVTGMNSRTDLLVEHDPVFREVVPSRSAERMLRREAEDVAAPRDVPVVAPDWLRSAGLASPVDSRPMHRAVTVACMLAFAALYAAAFHRPSSDVDGTSSTIS